MRIKQEKKPIKFNDLCKKALLVSLLVILGGCYRSPKVLYESGLESAKSHDLESAMALFEQVVQQRSHPSFSLLAAKEAASISFFRLKDYKRALKYYKFIVLNSQNQMERIEAQKQIISIYFDHEQDYKNAIKEITKFIFLNGKNNEYADKIKINLAKCYLHLGNFEQAIQELTGILKDNPSTEVQVEALLLMGNIYLNQKNNLKSAEVFKTLLDKHTESALRENVPVLLSVVLEDNNDFKGAIEILKKYETKMTNKEYVELRLKKLAERIRNAPGTRGFRK